jgi:hypothetical protein
LQSRFSRRSAGGPNILGVHLIGLTLWQALSRIHGDGRLWRVGRATSQCFCLWKWPDGSNETCSYELTCQQLHNLLARGDVPLPGGLHLRDAALWAGLIAYALDQSRRLLCPCRYLGVPIGGGKYQPDPSLWDSATAESKSKMIVCFVWEHLTVGPQKKPHVVRIKVNHALNDHRPPPRWPLRSRNEWYNFTVDWLNVFAEFKKPGMSYLGVSYPAVVTSLVRN